MPIYQETKSHAFGHNFPNCHQIIVSNGYDEIATFEQGEVGKLLLPGLGILSVTAHEDYPGGGKARIEFVTSKNIIRANLNAGNYCIIGPLVFILHKMSPGGVNFPPTKHFSDGD